MKSSRTTSFRFAAGFAAALLIAACARNAADKEGHVRPKGEANAPPPIATQIAWLGDLHQPEGVKYDADQDVFFISNMVGFGSVKDGNGYIVEVKAGDLSIGKVFAENGRAGVVLDAPKGMAINGDTLWICDIDKMRAINRKTGLYLGDIDLKPYGALLLNDVTIGGDGAMYITDTGILMTEKGVIYQGADKIFRLAGGKVSIVASGAGLMRPNGITWDKESNRLVVVTFTARCMRCCLMANVGCWERETESSMESSRSVTGASWLRAGTTRVFGCWERAITGESRTT
jgi:hypothetical protein